MMKEKIMGAISGSREPSPSSTGLGPTGFDPERDGFNNARLGYVLSRVTALAAKRAQEIAYGTWNPRFCSADASEYAHAVLTEIIDDAAFYRDQAAIAMETRRAETGNTDSVAKP